MFRNRSEIARPETQPTLCQKALPSALGRAYRAGLHMHVGGLAAPSSGRNHALRARNRLPGVVCGRRRPAARRRPGCSRKEGATMVGGARFARSWLALSPSSQSYFHRSKTSRRPFETPRSTTTCCQSTRGAVEQRALAHISGGVWDGWACMSADGRARSSASTMQWLLTAGKHRKWSVFVCVCR